MGHGRGICLGRGVIVGCQIRMANDRFAVKLNVTRPGIEIFLAGVLGRNDALLRSASGLGAGGLRQIRLVLDVDGLVGDLDGTRSFVGVRSEAETRVRNGYAWWR